MNDWYTYIRIRLLNNRDNLIFERKNVSNASHSRTNEEQIKEEEDLLMSGSEYERQKTDQRAFFHSGTSIIYGT